MSKLSFTLTAVLLMLAATSCQKLQTPSPASSVLDAKKYYAVLLANGSVYFGHMEGLGSPYPVLRDVYYVQSSQNPETKEVKNILVKRGKEWHGPDRMIVNEKSIVFIEPVGLDSTVAKLIEESKR
jgi:hypothetical protein